MEPLLIGTALSLLTYYIAESLKNKNRFIKEAQNRTTLTLIPTIFMASANMSAYIELKTLWFFIVGGHFLYSLFFYKKVLFKGLPIVSDYIPLAGLAVNIPHARLFQADLLGWFLLLYAITGYLLVSCRLILYWKHFITANPLPLLGILCAPLSLCIQGALIYLDNSLLIKGALILSLVCTFIVYLVIGAVFIRPFSLSWASLTFPTSVSALAHLQGGIFLENDKLTAIGYCEVFFSCSILMLVSIGALIKIFPRKRLSEGH